MKTVGFYLIIFSLLAACSSPPLQPPTAGSVRVTPSPTITAALSGTPTAVLTATVSPTPGPTPNRTPTEATEPTLTPTVVPLPTQTVPPATLAAEATITAFGERCEAPAYDWRAEISPDGNWIALTCRYEDGNVNSYLRIVSLHDERAWVMRYADYAHGTEYDQNDLLFPFHWSADGRYLYAASESRVSGCCWIGWYRLLVRLNLDNGQQTEVVRFAKFISADFSFSASDRYFLYIPQTGKGELYVLDLLTWGTSVIKLAFGHSAGAGYTVMSDDDERIVLVQREYPPDPQGDLTFGSLVVIDLKSGAQRKLLSGMEYEQTPQPIRWTDADHVLLRGEDGYWLLNVNTAELTPTEAP